jgi:hypothetical protein
MRQASEASQPLPSRAVSSNCSLAGAISKAYADGCQEGRREGVFREGLPRGIADGGDICAPGGIRGAHIEATGSSLVASEFLPRFEAMKRILKPRPGLSVEFDNRKPGVDADRTAKGGRGVDEPEERI